MDSYTTWNIATMLDQALYRLDRPKFVSSHSLKRTYARLVYRKGAKFGESAAG
jgi:hypothetical protein